MRLTFFALCLPLLLWAADWLLAPDAVAERIPFPDYMQVLLAIVFTAAAGKVLERMLGKGWFWRKCDQLLSDAIASRSITFLGVSLQNLRSPRQRGDHTAWRTTMRELELSVAANGPLPPHPVRARDAAQRLTPLTMLALSACVTELSAQWFWPPLTAHVSMQAAELAFSLVMAWLIWGTFLGGCASIAVAPWIRSRCH
jgi:hypothetical protein